MTRIELCIIWLRTAFLLILSQMVNLSVSATMPQAPNSCLSSGSGRKTKRCISKNFAKVVKIGEVCEIKCRSSVGETLRGLQSRLLLKATLVKSDCLRTCSVQLEHLEGQILYILSGHLLCV